MLPTSSSNVSPRMGLNGFQVRSLPPNGPMQNAVTHANLRTPCHADKLAEACPEGFKPSKTHMIVAHMRSSMDWLVTMCQGFPEQRCQ